jgi:hypothetical protein
MYSATRRDDRRDGDVIPLSRRVVTFRHNLSSLHLGAALTRYPSVKKQHYSVLMRLSSGSGPLARKDRQPWRGL